MALPHGPADHHPAVHQVHILPTQCQKLSLAKARPERNHDHVAPFVLATAKVSPSFSNLGDRLFDALDRRL